MATELVCGNQEPCDCYRYQNPKADHPKRNKPIRIVYVDVHTEALERRPNPNDESERHEHSCTNKMLHKVSTAKGPIRYLHRNRWGCPEGQVLVNALTGQMDRAETYLSGYWLIFKETNELCLVSNYMVKAQFIAALCVTLMLSLLSPARQNHDNEVRTHWRLLKSQPLKIVRPKYPALARQTNIEGRISLDCVIGVDGSVEKIKVKKGHPLLIQAATEAISQ